MDCRVKPGNDAVKFLADVPNLLRYPKSG